MTDLFTKKQAEDIITSLYYTVKDVLQTNEVIEKDYHYEFSIKEEKETVKVLVYFGKKGVKKVIQGNPSESLRYLLVDEIKPEVNEPNEYIGSDETGKGDIFGPLVTCAFYVDGTIQKKLKSIGVRDSKELSDARINKIASELKKIAKDNFEIISIHPKRYNELYARFKNINEILNWSHSKAIENLLSRKPVEKIITDKFRKKDLKFSKQFDYNSYEIIQETKAEKYTAVAAASILARSKQLEWFSQQKKNGLELKRGASKEVNEIIHNLIKNYGKEYLIDFAKMHFKPISNL